MKKGVPCNKDATRGLEQLIGRNTTSTASAPVSIVQACEMVRGGNARGKRKAGTSTTSYNRTPSNNVFLRNKGLGHRGSRNDLIELVDTPEKEIVPMHERARQRATRKSFSPTASPGTVEVADIVQERLAKGDQVLVSVCKDMHPACLQEALGYCMTKVRRERSRGN
jgi:hypothetical protein